MAAGDLFAIIDITTHEILSNSTTDKKDLLKKLSMARFYTGKKYPVEIEIDSSGRRRTEEISLVNLTRMLKDKKSKQKILDDRMEKANGW